MAKKTANELVGIIRDVYFKGQYDPQKHYLTETALLHSRKITGIGGEQKLNDANTKVLVGVSDFNGTLVPTDFKGLIRAMAIGFGESPATGGTDEPALISYSYVRDTSLTTGKDIPAWFQNSEIVLKTGGVEVLRTRVSEFLIDRESDKVRSEWAKEFEKTVKITAGQELEIFLNTPTNASLGTERYFVQLVIYGLKFADRKSM